jgi:NAD-dependent DNA ligase
MTSLDENAQPIRAFNFVANEKKAINNLYGILLGMTSDGVINDQEIHFLNLWLLDNEIHTKLFPLNVVKSRIQDILADGKITEQERQDFYDVVSKIIGGTFQETGSSSGQSTQYGIDEPEQIIFENAKFCFTGAFVTGTRSKCEAIVTNQGAITASTVTKDLDYLVIGALASRDWIGSSHGRKIEKAISYKEQGHPIIILHEETWQKFL